MNVLCMYDGTQTYTATVFEHLRCFSTFSRHSFFFVHQPQTEQLSVDLSHFDAVVIHYTIRLPFDQIGAANAKCLANYPGLKALFIQDEYDDPRRAWHWIRLLGISLVFTVVPQHGIARVYPPEELPGVRFVSVLTGYVPEDAPVLEVVPPSQRQLVVGYRGRPLPIRYGDLGREKVSVGRLVADYCRKHGIAHDIAWSEAARIYGTRWYEFVSSCRAMLGSESGSNVFDWEGDLAKRIEAYRALHPHASDDAVYSALIEPLEQPGLMNQISARVFEAIAARTVLVLFEGAYSDVVVPGEHFIALRKDGSNLPDVFRMLADGPLVDAMAERAYRDVIASGRYSYRAFVSIVDTEIAASAQARPRPVSWHADTTQPAVAPSPITTAPLRAPPPKPSTDTLANAVHGSENPRNLVWRVAVYVWWKLPGGLREALKPRLRKLLGRD
jgi:hypothetical protein